VEGVVAFKRSCLPVAEAAPFSVFPIVSGREVVGLLVVFELLVTFPELE